MKPSGTLQKKPNIVTIGGGNGHSNILGAIQNTFLPNIELSAIVSMSDDGRTTGRLMRHFDEDLGIHFPPPGDVRRCLYFLSGSAFREDFEKHFETVIQDDEIVSELTLGEIAAKIGADEYLRAMHFPYMHVTLPIKSSLEGHKFGNILMGAIFHHLGDDYNAMMNFMHEFLMVNPKVIPVTTDRAFIQAELTDGTLVEKQDRISNEADYIARIATLSLMPDSKSARHNPAIAEAIGNADYIILAPGDLYTSTISNLIIGGVPELIQNSHAKIIFIANTTNKGGETGGYTLVDFIKELKKYLGKNIDIVIANNARVSLSHDEEEKFKKNISVKGGEYLYLSEVEKEIFEKRGVRFVETDLIDRKTLYKHDKQKIAKVLEQILFHGLIEE